MDKPSRLERWLTIIANLAVVGGILLVALELQQTTRAIEAQTRDSVTEKQMDYLLTVAASPTLATAVYVGSSIGTDEFTEGELAAYRFYIQAVFREWENSHYQYTAGLFSEQEFAPRVEAWRANLARQGWRELWDGYGPTFAPDFRAVIDNLIAEIDN